MIETAVRPPETVLTAGLPPTVATQVIKTRRLGAGSIFALACVLAVDAILVLLALSTTDEIRNPDQQHLARVIVLMAGLVGSLIVTMGLLVIEAIVSHRTISPSKSAPPGD